MKLLVPFVTVLAVATLFATIAYWAVTLSSRDTALPPPAPAPAPLQASAAPGLFGGAPGKTVRDEYHVIGILNLGPHSGAVIVATENGAPRTLAVGATLAGNTRIAEVKAHSVVLETDGRRSEIYLPAAQQAGGYLR